MDLLAHPVVGADKDQMWGLLEMCRIRDLPVLRHGTCFPWGLLMRVGPKGQSHICCEALRGHSSRQVSLSEAQGSWKGLMQGLRSHLHWKNKTEE